MTHSTTTSDLNIHSNQIKVDEIPLHYLEVGSGNPILFLHGVPGSAWMWEAVFPYLTNLGRCIALDLPGFGQSGHPNEAYTLSQQIDLLEKFIQTLNLNHIILVVHGWGSIPGLYYAMQHSKKITGLVLYESWLRSSPYDQLSLPYQEYISHWKTKKNLEFVMTHGMQFIQQTLQYISIQPVDENSLAHFCAPFLQTGSGKSLYQYLIDAPAGDEKSATNQLIQKYSQKLCQSSLPKLLLYSIPGFVTTIESLMWAKKNFPQLEIVEVGEDLHFSPQSHAKLMGETISIWLQGVETVL